MYYRTTVRMLLAWLPVFFIIERHFRLVIDFHYYHRTHSIFVRSTANSNLTYIIIINPYPRRQSGGLL